MTALALLCLTASARPALARIAAEADAAELRLRGEVTGSDHQTYREVPFDVPDGVERITLTLVYDKANRTVIDLGVWDPQRFRGWSGGTRDRFTIGASDASPGYLPGEIPAGRWRVMLGLPNVRKDSRSAYAITISFDRGGAREATAAIADPPLVATAGWYRGDLHMHDANSDGSCVSQGGRRVPCPLFRTVEAAARAGLDFVAVTDHNTTAHFDGLRELQPWFDRTLLIPGIEITTFKGHANIFGPAGFVDFRVGTRAVPDMPALERLVGKSGAIMSINHPAAPSGEDCMGCGWTWADTDYAGIAAIEVVNGPLSEGPYSGLAFWYARLNEGHRLTGIGGSDNHDPDALGGKPPVGRPGTVVHAAELSQKGILAGIQAGNLFIDVEGSPNRLLEVEAASGREKAVMGQQLPTDGAIAVRAHIIGAAGGKASLIADGVAVQAKTRAIGSDAQSVDFSLDAGAARKWISVNVRNEAGRLLLIGNPIYLTTKHGR